MEIVRPYCKTLLNFDPHPNVISNGMVLNGKNKDLIIELGIEGLWQKVLFSKATFVVLKNGMIPSWVDL